MPDSGLDENLLKNNPNSLVVITAPSGAGKTTLIKQLIQAHPEFSFSVSHTTRPPREKEKEGEDYFFISEAEFKKKVKAGHFLEWAKVHNHLYGTSFAEINEKLRQQRRIILDIDVQGGLFLKKKIPALYIYIGVKDPKVLEKRLVERGKDSPKTIAQRVKNAHQELRQMSQWEHVIINDDLSQAVQEMQRLIFGA